MIICDNIIYDYYPYLNFTYINSLNRFIINIKFKEFDIGNLTSLANAFDNFLNSSYNIKQLLFLKKHINYSFFLTIMLNSLLLRTSMSHSRISPVEISNNLTTSLGMVVLREFEFGFALLTLVLYLNIIISPYIFLVSIIYVLLVIYNYPIYIILI